MYKSKEQGRIITKQGWQFLAVTFISILWCSTNITLATPVPPQDPDYRAVYDGNWDKIRDEHGYGLPEWENDYKDLSIRNAYVFNQTKQVWLSISYDLWEFTSDIWDISITAPDSVVTVSTSEEWPDDSDYIVMNYYWTLYPQPVYETIHFPSEDFYNLKGIERIDLVIHCVPEPATILMLGLGGLALRRKRRA